MSRSDLPTDETASFRVRALDASTWPDFAQLVERHNGVWGGCWCLAFHSEGLGQGRTAAQNRSIKEQRVREGRAHAALVYEAQACVGWCQFGSADELPRVKSLRAYERGLTTGLADHLFLHRPAPPWPRRCVRRPRGRPRADR